MVDWPWATTPSCSTRTATLALPCEEDCQLTVYWLARETAMPSYRRARAEGSLADATRPEPADATFSSVTRSPSLVTNSITSTCAPVALMDEVVARSAAALTVSPPSDSTTIERRLPVSAENWLVASRTASSRAVAPPAVRP